MRDISAVDKYTAAHGLAGYGAGWLGLDWRAALGLAIAYEAIEDGLIKKFGIFPRSRPESKHNALTDLAAFLAGYVVAYNRWENGR